MKKLKLILAGSLIVFHSTGISCAQAESKPSLYTAQQKLGYALGIEMGKSLKKMHPDIDLKALLVGIQDSYCGKPLLLDEAETIKIKTNFRERRFRQNKMIQNDKLLLEKEAKLEKAAEKPAYNLDFSMIDQKTPRNAAWSFIILYNDIMPVFTETHLNKICQVVSTPKFMSGCLKILQKRLDFLKKDPAAIKRAIFTNPKISISKTRQNTYDLSWTEILTSPDGRKTVNHKKIFIQLSKMDKWQIKSAHFIK